MNKPANHLAGEQPGKRNYQRREDQQEGDGKRQEHEPGAQAGDDEEE